jgi:hypothetical protein
MRRARIKAEGPARLMSGFTRKPDYRQTSCHFRKVPTGDIPRREALLSHLEHVHRETIGVNLAIHVGPKAIHLIALDTFDGHQWPS